MPTTQRLQTLAALCGLALAAVAAAGGVTVIPAPVDLWHWILDGGFFGLLVLDLVALALGWVIPAPAAKATLSERDKRISDLVIENATLREGRGRSLDRSDRQISTMEAFVDAFQAIAEKKAGP